jgi:hypothetical protein
MLIWIRDLSDPGSGMKQFESGIRDKHPKSAHTANMLGRTKQKKHHSNSKTSRSRHIQRVLGAVG